MDNLLNYASPPKRWPLALRITLACVIPLTCALLMAILWLTKMTSITVCGPPFEEDCYGGMFTYLVSTRSGGAAAVYDIRWLNLSVLAGISVVSWAATIWVVRKLLRR